VIHPAEEGETVEETFLNIKEAAEGWLEVTATGIKGDNQIQMLL
jgi:predicted RNase H-like HicB family nuclease